MDFLLTRPGRPPPWGEVKANSMCFSCSTRTRNEGMLTIWLLTLHQRHDHTHPVRTIARHYTTPALPSASADSPAPPRPKHARTQGVSKCALSSNPAQLRQDQGCLSPLLPHKVVRSTRHLTRALTNRHGSRHDTKNCPAREKSLHFDLRPVCFTPHPQHPLPKCANPPTPPESPRMHGTG